MEAQQILEVAEAVVELLLNLVVLEIAHRQTLVVEAVEYLLDLA
jgi:hypothetical protein